MVCKDTYVNGHVCGFPYKTPTPCSCSVSGCAPNVPLRQLATADGVPERGASCCAVVRAHGVSASDAVQEPAAGRTGLQPVLNAFDVARLDLSFRPTPRLLLSKGSAGIIERAGRSYRTCSTVSRTIVLRSFSRRRMASSLYGSYSLPSSTTFLRIFRLPIVMRIDAPVIG